MNSEIIALGKKREFFWDDYLIDSGKTTAMKKIINPVKKECCFVFDRGQELSTISYPQILKVGDTYRMYYGSFTRGKDLGCLSVIESKDGISWTRPELDMFDSPGVVTNTVIHYIADGTFVFYDTNPSCPPEEKYKAVRKGWEPKGGDEKGGLWCHVSPDGYHFKLSHRMTTKGAFDSLNTCGWRGDRYSCYMRNFHNIPPGGNFGADGVDDFNRMTVADNEYLNKGFRDIRVMYSDDFVHWSEPKRIEYDDAAEFGMYTNNIEEYDRAPHIYIGFPTRYTERSEWTPNAAQIKSSKLKYNLLNTDHEPRTGLAVTDVLFMFSRDGEVWHKYNEAFMGGEYEREDNWNYGDGYPACGLVDGGAENYYMYKLDDSWNIGGSKKLVRYEIRKDGFACTYADCAEKVVVTKPIVFEGKDLHINFSTSAYGSIYVDLLDAFANPIPGKESFEIYGNNIDRIVYLKDGTDFSEYAGVPIRLRFRMMDAKLFSMWFE